MKCQTQSKGPRYTGLLQGTFCAYLGRSKFTKLKIHQDSSLYISMVENRDISLQKKHKDHQHYQKDEEQSYSEKSSPNHVQKSTNKEHSNIFTYDKRCNFKLNNILSSYLQLCIMQVNCIASHQNKCCIFKLNNNISQVHSNLI